MQENSEIIKRQDFGEWVNIDLYKDTIAKKCRGKLSNNEISTLSNMFAIIFAMKARDFVGFKRDVNPGEIEEDAKKCADNLYAYLLNNPSIRNDWLELFSIGYSGDSVQMNGLEQKYSISIENPSNDVEDDDYAVHAALFVSALDPNLNEEHQKQITKAVIQKTESRKQIVKTRLAKLEKKQKWKTFFRSLFVEKSKDKGFDGRKASRYFVLPINYALRGAATAIGMIAVAKLAPAFGFVGLVSGGVIGYSVSSQLVPSARQLFLTLSTSFKFSPLKIFENKKVTPKSSRINEQVKEIDPGILKLKESIEKDIKAQRKMIAKYSKTEKEVGVNSINKESRSKIRQKHPQDISTLIDDGSIVQDMERFGVGNINDYDYSEKPDVDFIEAAKSLRNSGVSMAEDASLKEILEQEQEKLKSKNLIQKKEKAMVGR